MKLRSLQNKEANNKYKKKGYHDLILINDLDNHYCCRGALVKVQSLTQAFCTQYHTKWRTSLCQLSITNKLLSHFKIVKQIYTLIFAHTFLCYIEPTWGLCSINFCADISEILKLRNSQRGWRFWCTAETLGIPIKTV